MTADLKERAAKEGDVKQCRTCGAVKPLSEFAKHSTARDRKRSSCRKCNSEKAKYLTELRKTPEQRARLRAYATSVRHTPRVLEKSRRHARASRERYPEKAEAHRQLRLALKQGKIIKPDACQSCRAVDPRCADGRTALHGHHHRGYDNPLEVMWLCALCHRAEHDRIRNAMTAARMKEEQLD